MGTCSYSKVIRTKRTPKTSILDGVIESREIRNQTQIVEIMIGAEVLFLIKGEMRVKYESESILLPHEYGDYAIHDSIRRFKI